MALIPSKKQLILLVPAALLGVWGLSSLNSTPSPKDGQQTDTSTKKDISTILQIKRLQMQEHQKQVVLYGATAPNRQVELKAETQGTVKNIPATEGQPLKKGEVIVEIDERDRRLQYAQAQALLKQREIEYKAAKRLQHEGFQTEIRLAEAKTQLEEARVGLRRIDLDLQRTKLRSPFDGILETLNIEVGDFVGVGVFGGEGALATVVDADPILITGRIAEKDRPYIELGSTATGKLANGTQMTGNITYLASVAERESRTFRIEVEVPNPDRALPAGVTAELSIPAQRAQAYFVSPSVLTLDDAGQVGVKLVDTESRVQFHPVEIIEDTKQGMWVAGLPDEVTLITVGHAFVSPGTQLDPAMVAQMLDASPATQPTAPKGGIGGSAD